MFNQQVDDITIAQHMLSGICTRCGIQPVSIDYSCSDCYMYHILPDAIRKQIDTDIFDKLTSAVTTESTR